LNKKLAQMYMTFVYMLQQLIYEYAL